MEALVFKVFSTLFETAKFLLVAGLIAAVLLDIQQKAFSSKTTGLVSLLKVNQQLVGKTK